MKTSAFVLVFALLAAGKFAAAAECSTGDSELFEAYIQKRQELKLTLIAFRSKVQITGTRIQNNDGRQSRYHGSYSAIRAYSHANGAEYLNGRYSGDKMFKSAPLWNDGPIKIFVEQDMESNGPFHNVSGRKPSRINLDNYQLSGCDMNRMNEETGERIFRFEVVPRREDPGLFVGYIEVDADTLLTLAEVSTKTYLSDKARANLGGRMTEFTFERLYKIIDGRVAIPYLFRTHGKSRWSWYAQVDIEARFDLIDYKTGDR